MTARGSANESRWLGGWALLPIRSLAFDWCRWLELQGGMSTTFNFSACKLVWGQTSMQGRLQSLSWLVGDLSRMSRTFRMQPIFLLLSMPTRCLTLEDDKGATHTWVILAYKTPFEEDLIIAEESFVFLRGDTSLGPELVASSLEVLASAFHFEWGSIKDSSCSAGRSFESGSYCYHILTS